MDFNQNECYRSLIKPEDHILFSGANAGSFQEIVDLASRTLNAAIIVADALHYILAVTADIRQNYAGTISWLELIDGGWVPPVAEAHWADTEFHRMPRPFSECISETIRAHSDLRTITGQYCTMFDLIDGGNIVLKLAITSANLLTQAQRRTVLSLLNAVQLAYYRLGVESRTDARGRYLLQLLRGDNTAAQNLSDLNGFDQRGPFCLACFDMDCLGVHNLSFLPTFGSLTKWPQQLTVIEEDFFILLLNTRYEPQTILQELNNFSIEHGIPILLSRTFDELGETGQQFQTLKEAVALASKFHGAKGIQRLEEYTLFLMFERICRQEGAALLFHPDAERLAKYDAEKHTQYVQTVYCYLFHNCEAPVTADALYIHRNTLDKRMHKIGDLIAADWRNVTYQIRMLFSLFCVLSEEKKLPYYRQPSSQALY